MTIVEPGEPDARACPCGGGLPEDGPSPDCSEHGEQESDRARAADARAEDATHVTWDTAGNRIVTPTVRAATEAGSNVFDCSRPVDPTSVIRAEEVVLPDIEIVSARVHEAWMDGKRAKGVTTRLSETGEELMVPYADLSDAAKELDRASVRAVYVAISAAMKEARRG